MAEIKRWLVNTWCNVMHGGGVITRDPLNRINWQCGKCGRWSDWHVEHEEEERITNRQIAKHKQELGT